MKSQGTDHKDAYQSAPRCVHPTVALLSPLPPHSHGMCPSLPNLRPSSPPHVLSPAPPCDHVVREARRPILRLGCGRRGRGSGGGSLQWGRRRPYGGPEVPEGAPETTSRSCGLGPSEGGVGKKEMGAESGGGTITSLPGEVGGGARALGPGSQKHRDIPIHSPAHIAFAAFTATPPCVEQQGDAPDLGQLPQPALAAELRVLLATRFCVRPC